MAIASPGQTSRPLSAAPSKTFISYLPASADNPLQEEFNNALAPFSQSAVLRAFGFISEPAAQAVIATPFTSSSGCDTLAIDRFPVL